MEQCSLDRSLAIKERTATWTPLPLTRTERWAGTSERSSWKSTTHEATSMTIDGAIDYTIGLFDDTDRLEAILAEESAEASTSDQAA